MSEPCLLEGLNGIAMALEQELQFMLLQYALDLAYDDMYEAHEAHGYQKMDMNNEEQQQVELPLMRLCSNDC